MATVTETIPAGLQVEVDAALAWFNESQEQSSEVTGIVDPSESIAESYPRELKLVLCSGDSCLQRSFHVLSAGGDISFAPCEADHDVSGAEDGLQGELDPPPGARRNWLASALGRHEFVILLFCRGFW